MTNKIHTTEVQDWTSRTLKVFEGDKIDMALDWIDKVVVNELAQEHEIEDFGAWLDTKENETLYESYHEDYYIICRNENGKEVEFSF